MPSEPPTFQDSTKTPTESPVKTPTVSWYPPHMYRAQKRLARELKNVDVVIEMRDARLPESSGNPELVRLIGDRRRLLLFNKAALADPNQTARWKDYYRDREIPTLFMDADSGSSVNLLYPMVKELAAPGLKTLRARGIRPPPRRLMIAGIPNVGKSTLINRMVRGKKQPTAPEPGVTKAVSWVALKRKFLLMDTPGVLLPKIEQMETAMRLGWIGAIRDRIIGEENLARALLDYLSQAAPQPLASHYGLESAAMAEGGILLEAIARRRGMLRHGGRPDTAKAAVAVLGDFRRGALGRHTLELPP